MREEKWAPVVEEASSGKLPVHIDLDPTLLLKAEDYTEHLTQGLPVESEPYILTYTMGGETQKQIYNAAKMLSEKLKMRVIDVSGDPGFMNRKVKDNRLCDKLIPWNGLFYLVPEKICNNSACSYRKPGNRAFGQIGTV